MQDANPAKKLRLTAHDIYTRLAALGIDREGMLVYGIPNGGTQATKFLRHAKPVENPQYAHVLLDDLVATGATKRLVMESAYFSRTHQRFVGLWDMTAADAHMHDTWLVFPWEEDAPHAERSGTDVLARMEKDYHKPRI